MKLSTFFLLAFATNVTYGQWVSRVLLVDADDYFDRVMQETVLQLEENGFSNLKVNDITQSISQEMYKWHVVGNVTYTNGFLVSVQKIDLTDVTSTAGTSTVDGVAQVSGAVHGRLNIRDMKIGYDVLAELGEDGDHKFTGTFVHTLTRFHFHIYKNLHTNEITATSLLENFSGGLDRMVYMPANNITQVISRTYLPGNAWDSVSTWGREIILPIILDIATNKLEFPSVCLDCR